MIKIATATAMNALLGRNGHLSIRVTALIKWNIIAHYYQLPEIQDVADFVGDSYAMAVAAKQSSYDTILVAGVDFMAESAAILFPGKTILSPEPKAARWLMASRLEMSLSLNGNTWMVWWSVM